MCRFKDNNTIDENGCQSDDNEYQCKPLMVLTIIKQKADFAIEDICNISEIMQKTKHILSNIVVIHENIKENVAIAIKRINRLSQHLETYEQIIKGIDHNFEFNIELRLFSEQIENLLQFYTQFNKVWAQNHVYIKQSYDLFLDQLKIIVDNKKLAETVMSNKDYLKLTDIELICKTEYKCSKDLDQTCNQLCKESGEKCSNLCNKVNNLENNFNRVLKQSLIIIDSMKKKC